MVVLPGVGCAINWLVTAKCWVVSCGSCSPYGKAPALLKMANASGLHRNLRKHCCRFPISFSHVAPHFLRLLSFTVYAT